MSIRTALSIVQEFRRGINQSVPTALFGSTDPDELQMLEHLNQVCEHMRSRGPFRQQIRKHSFSTSASDTTYSLPGDFWEAVPITQFNENTQYPLIGPVSDAEFVFYRERGLSTPYEYIWRVAGFDTTASSVEGRIFEIFPAPADTQTLSFDYISGNLYLPTAWLASPDADIHETLSADTDYCMFDPSAVKLGLKWKYMDDTSNDAAKIKKAKDEFEDQLTRTRVRFHGSRSGRFGSRKYRRWYPIPERNWSF